MREFDLHNLYQRIWGFKSIPFPTGDIKNILTPKNPFEFVEAYVEQFDKSPLGVPIISPLKIDNWKLGIDVMVKVQNRQRIIRRYTHHTDNKGSIKEQWGLDDYNIDIRGLFFSTEEENLGDDGLDKDLTDSIKKLNEHFEKGMVKVENPLLSLFGIGRIMIESVNFPFDRKGLKIIPFEIKALSDFKQDDLLIENNN